ncbi:MAG: CHASE2 domain-containing protein, partial [Smithellaceae bacterium]
MSLQSVLAHVRKHIAFILIGMIIIPVMAHLGFFLGMNYYCYDLFFRLRGPQAPNKQISLVVIDEKTLEKYGQWPVSRRYYAELLNRLRDARMVGLDILMIEQASDDAALADAVLRHGRVVFPLYIARDGRIVHSSKQFSPQAAGHIHLEQDIDGVVRSVYHTLYHGEQALPSFTSLMYEKITGKPMKRESPHPSHADSSGILQMDRMKIDYYGSHGTFPAFSMVDVIEGKYSTGFFEDRIVLVGVTAEGLEAGVLTPLSQKRNHTSGVETHAHILNDLLEPRRIVSAPQPIVWFLCIFLSFLCFWFIIRWDGWPGVLGWIICIAVAFAAAFFLFAFLRFWFSPVPFAVLHLFIFFLAYVFRLEEAGMQIAEGRNLWEDSFNTIDDPIIVMDAGGIALQMNQAARWMQKENPRLFSLITGKCPGDLLDSADQHHTPPEGLLRKPVLDEVIDMETDRYFTVKTLPRYDFPDRLAGCVQVIEEITAQRKAARERLRLETELMQAQKMESIGTLAGGVAHDFNNILMGIQGYVSLLLFDLNPADERYVKLKKIESQVQSAAHLTRQLLGFARGGQYEVKSTDINELLHESTDVFGRTKKEISISSKYEKPIWPVMVDRGQIQQVLLNMYINSWHAMPDGGDLQLETKNIVLDVEDAAENRVSAGRYVQITVADTGGGMDEHTRKRVFEPFFTTKEQGKGTG